jgi:hypothetical protein
MTERVQRLGPSPVKKWKKVAPDQAA